MRRIFRFKIGAYTPATIPMERLAEYMRELATMLGEPASVHFVELKEASTNILHAIDAEAVPIVEERLRAIRRGDADVVYMSSYRALNKKLREDDASGELVEEGEPNSTATLLEFPGKLAGQPDVIDGVKQAGTIDGVLIALGGRDNTVPVRVQDGDVIYKCNTSRLVARELGAHIFRDPLRFVGFGTWSRNEEGVWSLAKFDINAFEEINADPLRTVVGDLRAIRGEWSEAPDPWGELIELRHGGNEPH